MKSLIAAMMAAGLLACTAAQAQLKPSDYFRLDVRQYTEDGATYLGVSPDIRTDTHDTLARAIRRFPRRFRYLLSRIPFQERYERYYPDTTLINRLYTDSLAMNQPFMSALDAMLRPFADPAARQQRFTERELMQTAARFFYCEGINPDSTFRTYICISMNGISAGASNDRLLPIEAFCFEAIFENYRDQNGKTRSFVTDFKQHAVDALSKFSSLAGNAGPYLASAREYCYSEMEKNKTLRDILINYYKAHKNDLGFRIQPDGMLFDY